MIDAQAAMKDLEAIVHPLVVSEREKFLAALPEDSQLVVFDIPLLYETEGEDQVLGRGVLNACAARSDGHYALPWLISQSFLGELLVVPAAK